MLQPEIAAQLGDNKAAAIAKTEPEIVASSNLGCMVQLQERVEAPVVHLVELLDWASGGEKPEGVSGHD
jgi:glycolate oxidase iron-sulfur subunit